jgi:hypothetical protein
MSGNKQKGFILQDRERHLLHELGVMRVIDRELAKWVCGFMSTTRANARLLALTLAGLLRRFFIGSEKGGKKALYTLTREGQRLGGAALPGLWRRRDAVLVADFFVTHQLFINQIYCLVKYREIPLPDVRFLRWVGFHEPIASGTSLIPDGYFELAQREKVTAAFLEVDLGTESRAVWRNKVQEYLRYAVGGSAAEQFGASQFRVLVVTNSEGRLSSLRSTTAMLTEKIFWLTTFDSIEREGFWSPIWLRPRDDRRRALLEAQP